MATVPKPASALEKTLAELKNSLSLRPFTTYCNLNLNRENGFVSDYGHFRRGDDAAYSVNANYCCGGIIIVSKECGQEFADEVFGYICHRSKKLVFFVGPVSPKNSTYLGNGVSVGGGRSSPPCDTPKGRAGYSYDIPKDTRQEWGRIGKAHANRLNDNVYFTFDVPQLTNSMFNAFKALYDKADRPVTLTGIVTSLQRSTKERLLKAGFKAGFSCRNPVHPERTLYAIYWHNAEARRRIKKGLDRLAPTEAVAKNKCSVRHRLRGPDGRFRRAAVR